MKQVLILVLFCVCIFVSFAQSYDAKVSSDIGVIGRNMDKLLVYETHKKNPLVPFLLNFLVGFGVGSLFQGDIISGLLTLGSEILGLGLIGCGIYCSQHATDSSEEYHMSPKVALSLISLGGITCVVTRIVEMIIPFVRASIYNSNLKENLGISLGGLKPEFGIFLNDKDSLVFELVFTKKY